MHRRSVILGTALLIGLSVLIARQQECLACSCAAVATPDSGWTKDALLDQADVVFRGTVVARGPVTDLGGGVTNGQYTVVFAVDQVWKGTPQRFYRVTAGHGGGDCTISFRVGDPWLVYGYENVGGTINTGICNRTMPNYGGATGDLAVLGRGERPSGDGALSPAGRIPLVGRIMEFTDHLAQLSS
jgi:hypothetical protein